MLEALELAGAIAEFDEMCATCKRRVVLVTPSGDGDLTPTRLHEAPADERYLCVAAVNRGDTFAPTERIDELLGIVIEEGPAE